MIDESLKISRAKSTSRFRTALGNAFRRCSLLRLRPLRPPVFAFAPAWVAVEVPREPRGAPGAMPRRAGAKRREAKGMERDTEGERARQQRRGRKRHVAIAGCSPTVLRRAGARDER